MIKPELLAPAGDLTRMKYAFAYGATPYTLGSPLSLCVLVKMVLRIWMIWQKVLNTLISWARNST